MGKYNKVYVITPFHHCTGGVELAHQLVDYLRNRQQEAYVVYVNGTVISKDQTITGNYSRYNLKSTDVIEDSPDNIMVLPEIYFEFVLYYRRIKVACWWMSVDNRYNFIHIPFFKRFFSETNIRAKLGLIKAELKGTPLGYRNSDTLLKKEAARVIHLYQSHYAQFHLYSKGFTKVMPLSDYINLDLLGNIECRKKDVVLYNPAKGMEFTAKVMAAMPDTRFVALEGLNREQLRTLLETSKLYIDFGPFPGKDRLPREAVANGCCILTGRLGASYFYEDIPIDEQYKFDVNDRSIAAITEKIKYILNNYDRCKQDFDFFRSCIGKEQEVFYREIEQLFL